MHWRNFSAFYYYFFNGYSFKGSAYPNTKVLPAFWEAAESKGRAFGRAPQGAKR